MNETTLSTAEVRLIASTRTWIESAAVDQLKKTATLPGMRLAVGLPDLHPGKGTPIGAAFASEGWIYPLLVGNDIGCGVGLWRTSLNAHKPKRDAWADRLRGFEDGTEPGADESLGTIGGGNHFAELQAVERIADAAACDSLGIDAAQVHLCVHSGSRGLGEAILRDHYSRHGAAGLRAGTEEAGAYLKEHGQAVAWARANRATIAARMLARLKSDGEPVADICHNSVEPRQVGGVQCWLHRKGAAPSTCGPVVIPGSRGGFTYLVQPLDAGDRAACSLAHGAGRKWSRSDCRGRLEKRFKARDLERTAIGGVVVCDDRQLLYEEAPQAYKDIDTVIEDLVEAGLAEVLAVFRPLVTYKTARRVSS